MLSQDETHRSDGHNPTLPSWYSTETSSTSNGLPSFPPGLLQAVADSPPQGDALNYEVLHRWWWIVYDSLLSDMIQGGDESQAREVDRVVDH